MFFGLPLESQASLQQTVLVLNTILLIAALIIVELIYAEKSKAHRRAHLRYFLPIAAVMGGLLMYAFYLQIGKGV